MKQVCSPNRSSAVPLQYLPAEESARQGQKCFMDVSPLFIAHTQTAELIEPSEGALHHPPPPAQSTAMFGVTLGEPRHDMAGSQTSPDCLRVITTVAYHAIRTMARSSALSL